MKTKHTKANGNGNSWEVAEHHTLHEYKIVVHAHPTRIALCYRDDKGALYPNKEESIANAKLIAAAPELLETLTELLESYKLYVKNPSQSEFVINAENIINKATK